MGRERAIETAIKNFIFLHGGYITKCQSGVIPREYKGRTHMIHMGERGTPDMIGCLNGRFLGVEVKRDEKEVQKWLAYPLGLRGKPIERNLRNEAQKETSKRIREAGGVFAVVCSVEELEQDLKIAGVL
jgi:hypothetical protein